MKDRGIAKPCVPQPPAAPPGDGASRVPQEGQPEPGLVCRQCGCRHFYTIYTRPKAGYVMRLKRCRHCGRRMVTRECAG